MSFNIDTFSGLKAAILRMLARENDAEAMGEVANWIRLAESRLQREIDWPRQEESVSGTITGGSEYLALPSDFSWARALTILENPDRTVDIVSHYTLENVRDAKAGQIPLVAALSGGGVANTPRLRLAPVPEADYSYELIYFTGIPPLTDSNTTNWLLEEGPDVLFYTSLLHSAPFVGDDPRITTWSAFVRDALPSLRKLAKRQRTGGGPLRIRPDFGST